MARKLTKAELIAAQEHAGNFVARYGPNAPEKITEARADDCFRVNCHSGFYWDTVAELTRLALTPEG